MSISELRNRHADSSEFGAAVLRHAYGRDGFVVKCAQPPDRITRRDLKSTGTFVREASVDNLTDAEMAAINRQIPRIQEEVRESNQMKNLRMLMGKTLRNLLLAVPKGPTTKKGLLAIAAKLEGPYGAMLHSSHHKLIREVLDRYSDHEVSTRIRAALADLQRGSRLAQ